MTELERAIEEAFDEQVAKIMPGTASFPAMLGKRPTDEPVQSAPVRVGILIEGAKLTNGARDLEYGPPEFQFAASGELKAVFRKHLRRYMSHAELEAIDMALTKIGRLSTGNPKRDTYVDAATYMAIAGEIGLTVKTDG